MRSFIIGVHVVLCVCAFFSFVRDIAAGTTDLKQIQFTEEDKSAARERFGACDVDGKGKLTMPQLRTALEPVANNLSEDEMGLIVLAMDKNKDGMVDVEEYIRLMFLRKLFCAVDANSNGLVSRSELQDAVPLDDPFYREMRADTIMDIADINRDTFLNFSEFVVSMVPNPQ